MIYINDVLKRCEEKGHKVTRMGLYVAGKREGFIVEKNGEKELDIDKFNKWLEKAIQKVPEGYLSAKQIIEKYGVSQSEAYFILNDPDCESEKYGAYGVLYAKQERIESVITKRSKKHKYNWEEGKENGNN